MSTVPYISRKQRATGGMTTTPCIRCGHYWTFNSGNPQDFELITRYCPDCIAAHLPTLGGTT